VGFTRRALKAKRRRGLQKKRGIGGDRLSWRVRGNRFQFQIVDPGRPVDFIIKFHGRLADHLDPEKPGPRCNYKIMINA
jgi:hypothetical protein